MKAIVVYDYGGPEALKLEDLPILTPKQDETLIRVFAAGVNSFDGVLRSGKYAKIFKMQLPWIISFVEAAGVPSVALTAWQALVDKANLQSGQTVLIHGASGGVGLFAIPIAKICGAKVFATASTANQDFLKQLGADVAIDYKTQKFEEIAKDVDVVVDGVGGETLARSYPIVKRGGFLVSLVGRVDQAQLDKHGIRGVSLEAESNGDQLAQIGRLIDEKKIKVVVSETFPLADAAKAQTKADTGHARGKIVLKVRDEAN